MVSFNKYFFKPYLYSIKFNGTMGVLILPLGFQKSHVETNDIKLCYNKTNDSAAKSRHTNIEKENKEVDGICILLTEKKLKRY